MKAMLKKSKRDRVLALALKWVEAWPVGTVARLSAWGPVKVVAHQVSRGWPVVMVELVKQVRDMPSGTRLAVYYGRRYDLSMF